MTQHHPTPPARLHRLARIAGLTITVLLPILLTLASVRAVMSPTFLQFQYLRPGFPDDRFGFTLEDRLYYAPLAVEYLLNDSDISFLADLTFPNGEPLYNPRELRHMEDVKEVTVIAFAILQYGALAVVALSAGLFAYRPARGTLRRAWQDGALLTLAAIALIVLLAVFAWRFFFTAFHQLLFEDGTWVFFYSDTLIRLFPEAFWFTSALVIGGLTIAQALAIIGICRWLYNRAERRAGA